MAEYIERKALIEAAKHNIPICRCEADFVDIKRLIEDMPAADVAPVVHGYWIDNKHTDTAICSECKSCFSYDTLYCPKCGAKMDGKDGKGNG